MYLFIFVCFCFSFRLADLVPRKMKSPILGNFRTIEPADLYGHKHAYILLLCSVDILDNKEKNFLEAY